MRQIENKEQKGRPKPNCVNKKVKYKWTKHSNTQQFSN